MIGLYVLVTHALYIAFAIWVTVKFSRFVARQSSWMGGAAVALLSLAIFALIPVWDELLGLPEYKRLCENEVGIKIFDKMALPAHFYSDTGEPLFVHKNGGIDGFANHWNVGDKTELYRYVKNTGGEQLIRFPVETKTFWRCLYDLNENKKLVCATNISWGGGWWQRWFLFALIRPTPCPIAIMDFRALHKEVFYPERSMGSDSIED